MFLKMWLLVLMVGEGEVISYWDTELSCENHRKKTLTIEMQKKTMCMRADID